MSHAVSAEVKVGGAPLALRFDACRVLLGGEFAGNIELDVACDAKDLDTVVDCLRVQVPGSPPSDMALGNGVYAQGIELVFWTSATSQLPELPEEISLLWGETPIARIAPVLKDSIPIEQGVTFIDPSEILTSLPLPATSHHLLLAANRERWWNLLVALLVVGGGLVGATVPGLELPSRALNWALGGAMIAAGLGVFFVLAHAPYRQVWLDRDRRRVLIIGGRTRNPEAKLAEAPGRALDDFDHVRVYQRWRLAESVDEHDQEVWYVTLEGPLAFASADGTVHLHDEALPIAEFAGEFSARRLAAVVGFHTGLKILDTGHDQTA
jgi:hypothetical protein